MRANEKREKAHEKREKAQGERKMHCRYFFGFQMTDFYDGFQIMKNKLKFKWVGIGPIPILNFLDYPNKVFDPIPAFQMKCSIPNRP